MKRNAKSALKIRIYSKGDISSILSLVMMLEESMQKLISEKNHLKINIALLRSIPRIGEFGSAIILAERDDVSLFQKSKQLSLWNIALLLLEIGMLVSIFWVKNYIFAAKVRMRCQYGPLYRPSRIDALCSIHRQRK